MVQTFQDFPASELKRDSRPKIAARDEALRSSFSGDSAPTDPTPVDGQFWLDTSGGGEGVLKMRRNGAWVESDARARAPLSSPAFTGTPTAPTASATTNTTQIATTAMVQAALASYIAAQDVQVFKGGIDASSNPNYPAADAGHTYRITVAGKIGGASGANVEAGEAIVCVADSSASGNQATVGANWIIIQANIDGAVTGPSSSTADDFAQFNGTTGKVVKGGVSKDTDATMAADSDSRIATQKATRALVKTRWNGLVFDYRDYSSVGTVSQNINAMLSAMATALANSSPTAPAFGLLPPGQLSVDDTIIMQDRCILVGAGIQASVLKAVNALNKDMIQTPNFASLTGQNKWVAADGVLSFIGLQRLRIDGNKANQSSGNAASLIAKGLLFDDLLIDGAKGVGLYTECGTDPGVNAWDTMPEGDSRHVQIVNCGSHGWHNRGPHDLYGTKVTCCINGGSGMKIESAASTYQGTSDFGMLHCYANTGKGLHIKDSSLVKAAILRVEDNYEEGLYLENGDLCAFSQTIVSDNCRTSGSYQVEVDTNSDRNHIDGLVCRDIPAATVGGLRINGGDENFVRGKIRGNVVGGASGTAVGLDVANAARSNNIDLTVTGWAGTGGIGVRLGQTSAVSLNKIDIAAYNNDTILSNVNQGSFNDVRIIGYTNVTAFAGVNQGPTDEWDITINQNGTRKSSRSGSYTPTVTGVINVASSSGNVCRWTRRGDQITITGSISVTATAGATATYAGVSLPSEQSSNFSSSADATGVCSTDAVAQSGNVAGDATNDRLQLGFVAANTSAQTMVFMAQYTVK